MDNKECLRFLLTKSIDFHNRFNNSIEEIIRRENGIEEVQKLIGSLQYMVDDMERIFNVNKGK